MTISKRMLNVCTQLPWFALPRLAMIGILFKPLNKLTKTSYPVKIWERFNKLGAIIYSRELIGSLFELSKCAKNVVLMLCSVFA